MLVLVKLIPLIFELLSGHEMSVDDTHIFSVNGTISLSLHAFIYFGEIPNLFVILKGYFSWRGIVEFVENFR